VFLLSKTKFFLSRRKFYLHLRSGFVETVGKKIKRESLLLRLPL